MDSEDDENSVEKFQLIDGNERIDRNFQIERMHLNYLLANTTIHCHRMAQTDWPTMYLHIYLQQSISK